MPAPIFVNSSSFGLAGLAAGDTKLSPMVESQAEMDARGARNNMRGLAAGGLALSSAVGYGAWKLYGSKPVLGGLLGLLAGGGVIMSVKMLASGQPPSFPGVEQWLRDITTARAGA